MILINIKCDFSFFLDFWLSLISAAAFSFSVCIPPTRFFFGMACDGVVLKWLGRFVDALETGNDLGSIFAEECYWRDLVAFTWSLWCFHLVFSGWPLGH